MQAVALGPLQPIRITTVPSSRKFLALKWAMTEKFCEYLLGHKCVVYTDNNPLGHLSSATEQQSAVQLAAFNFETRYLTGRANLNADTLSH